MTMTMTTTRFTMTVVTVDAIRHTNRNGGKISQIRAGHTLDSLVTRVCIDHQSRSFLFFSLSLSRSLSHGSHTFLPWKTHRAPPKELTRASFYETCVRDISTPLSNRHNQVTTPKVSLSLSFFLRFIKPPVSRRPHCNPICRTMSRAQSSPSSSSSLSSLTRRYVRPRMPCTRRGGVAYRNRRAGTTRRTREKTPRRHDETTSTSQTSIHAEDADCQQ